MDVGSARRGREGLGWAAPTRASWARSSLSGPQLPHGGQGEDGARALSEVPGSRVTGDQDAAPSTWLGQTLPPAGISPQPPASPSPLSALILLTAAGSPERTHCSLRAKAMRNWGSTSPRRKIYSPAIVTLPAGRGTSQRATVTRGHVLGTHRGAGTGLGSTLGTPNRPRNAGFPHSPSLECARGP